MKETLIYPVSAGYIYRIMFGEGLYGGNAINTDWYNMAKAAAEICNTAHEVGRNNGRANVNRRREYLKELKKTYERDRQRKALQRTL